MPKDKKGNKITWGEFFLRWKRGIQEITPLQQVTTQINSTVIILVGILLGFGVAVYNWKTLWWLCIILGGAFINTVIIFLGLKQKQNLLNRIEKEDFDDGT